MKAQTQSKAGGKFTGLLRHAPVLIGAILLLLVISSLHHSLKDVQISEVIAHFRSIPLTHLLGAGLLVMASYSVLTLYDYIALRYVESQLTWRQTALTSFIAFAVGHNVGFSALSGGAIRFRAYFAQGLSRTQVSKVIVHLGITFVLGMSLLFGLSLLLAPASLMQPFHLSYWALKGIGLAGIALPALYIAWATLFKQAIKIRTWRYQAPSLSNALAQIMTAVIDLAIVSSIFFLLMPTDPSVSFTSFIGIYILALGAGVLSGIPGGVGVFEAAIIILLPLVPKANLLGAILAFRLFYYLVPLLIAVLALAFQELRARKTRVARLNTHL